jgi:hypothetical protein
MYHRQKFIKYLPHAMFVKMFSHTWNLKLTLCVGGSFFSSMAVPAHSGHWPLIQFCNHFSQTVKFLGRVISPSQSHCLSTEQHKHRINTNRGIRTHDPSVRASEGSSCLRPEATVTVVWGSTRIDPNILNLGARWSWAITFTPQPLHPNGKSSRFHWIWSSVGPRVSVYAAEKIKIFCSC